MNIHLHAYDGNVPTVEIEDHLLKLDSGEDRIVTEIKIMCGTESLQVTVFSDDSVEITDSRKQYEEVA